MHSYQALSQKVVMFLNVWTNFTSWRVGFFKKEVHRCPYFWHFLLLHFLNLALILFESSFFTKN